MFRKLFKKIRKIRRSVNSAEEKLTVQRLQPDIPVNSEEVISKIERLQPNIPVNSEEVISKVEQLRPELDKLIRQEFEDRVRSDIERIKAGAPNFVEYIRSISESGSFRYQLSEEAQERAALSLFDDLKRSYADYLDACPMSPEREQAYVERRAYENMHCFGACHGIWGTKKRILKEKYGIQWYTPDETQPDVYFD